MVCLLYYTIDAKMSSPAAAITAASYVGIPSEAYNSNMEVITKNTVTGNLRTLLLSTLPGSTAGSDPNAIHDNVSTLQTMIGPLSVPLMVSVSANVSSTLTANAIVSDTVSRTTTTGTPNEPDYIWKAYADTAYRPMANGVFTVPITAPSMQLSAPGTTNADALTRGAADNVYFPIAGGILSGNVSGPTASFGNVAIGPSGVVEAESVTLNSNVFTATNAVTREWVEANTISTADDITFAGNVTAASFITSDTAPVPPFADGLVLPVAVNDARYVGTTGNHVMTGNLTANFVSGVEGNFETVSADNGLNCMGTALFNSSMMVQGSASFVSAMNAAAITSSNETPDADQLVRRDWVEANTASLSAPATTFLGTVTATGGLNVAGAYTPSSGGDVETRTSATARYLQLTGGALTGGITAPTVGTSGSMTITGSGNVYVTTGNVVAAAGTVQGLTVTVTSAAEPAADNAPRRDWIEANFISNAGSITLGDVTMDTAVLADVSTVPNPLNADVLLCSAYADTLYAPQVNPTLSGSVTVDGTLGISDTTTCSTINSSGTITANAVSAGTLAGVLSSASATIGGIVIPVDGGATAMTANADVVATGFTTTGTVASGTTDASTKVNVGETVEIFGATGQVLAGLFTTTSAQTTPATNDLITSGFANGKFLPIVAPIVDTITGTSFLQADYLTKVPTDAELVTKAYVDEAIASGGGPSAGFEGITTIASTALASPTVTVTDTVNGIVHAIGAPARIIFEPNGYVGSRNIFEINASVTRPVVPAIPFFYYTARCVRSNGFTSDSNEEYGGMDSLEVGFGSPDALAAMTMTGQIAANMDNDNVGGIQQGTSVAMRGRLLQRSTGFAMFGQNQTTVNQPYQFARGTNSNFWPPNATLDITVMWKWVTNQVQVKVNVFDSTNSQQVCETAWVPMSTGLGFVENTFACVESLNPQIRYRPGCAIIQTTYLKSSLLAGRFTVEGAIAINTGENVMNRTAWIV